VAELMAECRASNPRWSEAEVRPWAQSKLQFDNNLFSRMAINPRSYEEQVPKINCPTLLIIADGGLVAKETAEKAAKIWKSKQPFRWVQIKEATHNIRRDNFPSFWDALFGFLKDLPAGKAEL
jgi:pimeloyl-ACP methyl ester carboxylesterase